MAYIHIISFPDKRGKVLKRCNELASGQTLDFRIPSSCNHERQAAVRGAEECDLVLVRRELLLLHRHQMRPMARPLGTHLQVTILIIFRRQSS